MKVHFNYKNLAPYQEIQLIIENDKHEEQYVSRFYKSEAELLHAFETNTLEKEEPPFDYEATLKKVKSHT
jgi:hypothetical protein